MFAFRKYLRHTRVVPTKRSAKAEPAAADVDAVLEACRSLVAISAGSLEAVADQVDLVELRILVVIASRETAGLKDVADTAGLHLTRASRACDRLVGKGLITRNDDPGDRRALQLGLTPAGEAVVHSVVDARRQAVAPILAAMSTTRRTELVRSLRAFTAASGGSGHENLSALAWTQ